MTNKIQNPKDQKKYDLKERAAIFGEKIIRLLITLPQSPINNPLINQLIRSATSIGGNYMEADGAESKKDFLHKIGICKKEAKETTHWLRMIATANPFQINRCEILRQETHELTLIFSSIINKK